MNQREFRWFKRFLFLTPLLLSIVSLGIVSISANQTCLSAACKLAEISRWIPLAFLMDASFIFYFVIAAFCAFLMRYLSSEMRWAIAMLMPGIVLGIYLWLHIIFAKDVYCGGWCDVGESFVCTIYQKPYFMHGFLVIVLLHAAFFWSSVKLVFKKLK